MAKGHHHSGFRLLQLNQDSYWMTIESHHDLADQMLTLESKLTGNDQMFTSELQGISNGYALSDWARVEHQVS